MMKRRLVCAFAAMAVPASLSCGLEAPGRDEMSAGEGASEVGTPGTPASTIDGDTRVVLERWPCYGNCPAYSLSIAGDGTVTYFGESSVNVIGPASKQVSTSDVQALVDQMLRADYFSVSVPETCPARLYTDAPGATTSLTLHGQTHTVDHYFGNPCAPARLGPLEDAIDILVDSSSWIDCDTPSGACCDSAVNPYLSCGE